MVIFSDVSSGKSEVQLHKLSIQVQTSYRNCVRTQI